jgi:threonine dehydrogenase-like Zn-dependent dehydrogenase
VTFSRTVWFEAQGAASLRVEPVKSPSDGEVLVRSSFSGISAGSERLVLLGRVPSGVRSEMRLEAMRGSFALPVAYGYANVGVIEAAGAAVPRERLGERVFALHPHQDLFVLDHRALRPLPEGPPAARMTLGANLETAINVIWDAEIALGDRVAITGLGVVGLLVAWLARRSGASVVAFDPDPERCERARALGAEAERAATASLIAEADVMIEASGAPAALAGLVEHAGPEARVVIAAWYGDVPTSLALGAGFHAHRVSMRSSQVARIAPGRTSRWTTARRWRLVCDLLRESALDALVAPPVPLSDASATYEELARGVRWSPPHRVFDASR